MRNSIRLPAFAKINLCLHILSRRVDGYHELRTIFQAISLHDTLEIERTRHSGILLETNHPALPTGPENLVWRAIEVMRREFHFSGGVYAKLAKRIPIERGLGGGSSDAAAAILGMLLLHKRRVQLARVVEIASRLGSDVPFFLFGGRALGVSRGDEIYPLPNARKQSVVIISPRDIGVSTRQAYSWASSELTTATRFSKLWSFCALCWSRQQGGLENDFQAPVFRRYPRLATIRRALLQRGAAEAALAGSGSAVFGLFQSPAQARRAARAFPKDQVFVTETLSREEYSRSLRVRLNEDGEIAGRR